MDGSSARLRTSGPSLDEDEWTAVGPGATLPEHELPPEARSMGLSSWTAPELALASSLNPRRRRARMTAWVLLLTAAVVPIAIALYDVVTSGGLG